MLAPFAFQYDTQKSVSNKCSRIKVCAVIDTNVCLNSLAATTMVSVFTFCLACDMCCLFENGWR